MDNLQFFEEYEHDFSFLYLQKASSDEWIFRCPCCGDSVEDETATRGHLRFDWGVFKCFRCGVSIGIGEFIKDEYNHIYPEYMRFKFKDIVKDDVMDEYVPTTRVIEKEKVIFEFKTKEELSFVPITDHMVRINEYLESRKLDRNNFLYDPKTDRIVIPYFNKEVIYYYQLRSIEKNVKNKYMFDTSRNINENNIHRNIYNIYNIDPDKPIQMLEGAIDSQLVENAIGNSGIGNIESNLLFIEEEFNIKKDNLYLILDFDSAGFEHLIVLSHDYYVFDWIKYIKDNELDYISDLEKLDINTLYLDLKRENIFKYDEFKDYYVKYSRQLEHKYKNLIRRFFDRANKDKRLFGW